LTSPRHIFSFFRKKREILGVSNSKYMTSRIDRVRHPVTPRTTWHHTSRPVTLVRYKLPSDISYHVSRPYTLDNCI
jgi:hypothetical protein